MNKIIRLCCRFSARSDDGSTNTIAGAAKVKDPAEPAKLEVSFSGSKCLSSFTSGWFGVSTSCVLFTPDSHPSHSSSPRPLLGALFRLWGSLSGLWLHRLWPVPHGAELDPEQGAHHPRRDPGASARHPDLHRRRREQDGPHQPGWGLLQRHEPLSSIGPVSFSSSSGVTTKTLYEVMTCETIWCIKPAKKQIHVELDTLSRSISKINGFNRTQIHKKYKESLNSFTCTAFPIKST